MFNIKLNTFLRKISFNSLISIKKIISFKLKERIKTCEDK